jgi:hypothetical protein
MGKKRRFAALQECLDKKYCALALARTKTKGLNMARLLALRREVCVLNSSDFAYVTAGGKDDGKQLDRVCQLWGKGGRPLGKSKKATASPASSAATKPVKILKQSRQLPPHVQLPPLQGSHDYAAWSAAKQAAKQAAKHATTASPTKLPAPPTERQVNAAVALEKARRDLAVVKEVQRDQEKAKRLREHNAVRAESGLPALEELEEHAAEL